MSKYQNWLLPLLGEQEKRDFTSKIDGVIEFLSDKMKMKDTFVYMGWMAGDYGFKGSPVFAYTKDDASPALLLLAHGVVSEDKPNYVYIGHHPYAHNIDTDAADSDSDSDARSGSDSDDNADAQESEEDDEDNYIYIGDPANDVDTSLALARNMDADADNDSVPYDPRCGPPFPPERMDPYVGSLVVTYVDSDKEALDAEDVADMESSKEAPGAFYYIQATISSVDFEVDSSKKRRVD